MIVLALPVWAWLFVLAALVPLRIALWSLRLVIAVASLVLAVVRQVVVDRLWSGWRRAG